MAKSLSLTLVARLASARFSDEYGTIALPDITADLAAGNGTGSGQADVVYVARRSVPSNASPDVLDLVGGTLYGYGPNGANTLLSFAKLVGLILINRDGTNTLTAGGGSNAVAGVGTLIVGPTDVGLFTNRLAGATVTAGTGDLIQVATSGGTNVPYDLVLLGRSA